MNEETLGQVEKEAYELRRKSWDELTVDQKVERQREVIKDLQRTINYMNERLMKMEKNFYQHAHGTDGKPVVPVSQFAHEMAGGFINAKSAVSNYF